MIKPNLNLPLATSYNERGVGGSTHAITNSEDQRKINCFYEVTKNAITGQGKLALTKRPGVTVFNILGTPQTFGISTEAAYAICAIPGAITNVFAQSVYKKNGNTIFEYGSGGAATTVASTSAGDAFIPLFLDTTNIGNTATVIAQMGSSTTPGIAQKVAYGSGSPLSWTPISDGDFTGTITWGKMECLDGFVFALAADGVNNQSRIINSDLNSIANWSATGFVNKQVQQDAPVGLAKLTNQLLAFGDNTVEIFYNAGNAIGSPLLPIKQLTQNVGMIPCALGGGHYYCKIKNQIFFVGRQGGGRGSIGVFSYNGSIFEKVSTLFIDKILAENISAFGNAISSGHFYVSTFGFNGKIAVAIALTASTAATQRWLMYFPELRDWFEWNSSTFCPINNGEFFLGVTPNQHLTYAFRTTDNWQDNTVNFTMSTQFKLPQDGHHLKRMGEFGVLADTARSSNQLLVEFSDDDYVSFQNIGNIELQRNVKTLNRGGAYRQRAVRLSSTNALEVRLHAFIARLE